MIYENLDRAIAIRNEIIRIQGVVEDLCIPDLELRLLNGTYTCFIVKTDTNTNHPLKEAAKQFIDYSVGEYHKMIQKLYEELKTL